jgi:hypothetical protein
VNQNFKRKVAISAAGVTVLAGGGLAFAATQSSPQTERKALLDNAAKRLNVSPDQLSAALQGAFEDQLDKAVADGRITKARADEIKARLKAGGGVPLGPPLAGGPEGRGFGHRGPGGPGGPGGHRLGGADAAAKYLGLTEDQLHTQLESGKSLADVAKAQGKDVAGLKTAIVDAAKADLDKAVTDNRITAAQRDQMVKDLESHVDDLIAGKLPDGPRGFRGRRGHFGPGGPAPVPPPDPATPQNKNGADPAPAVTGASPA